MALDLAGLALDDLYRPVIPSPPDEAADQGDPYLMTAPTPGRTRYRHYLYHTDVAPDGDRIPVYGSDDLRRFTYLGKALPTDAPMSQHWAPCVVHNAATGLYSMFYSRSEPGQPNPDVGQRLRRAVAPDPEGPFVDQGEFPLEPGTDFARPVSPPRVLVKPSLDVQMYERNRSMPWQVGKRDWAGGETVDWHCIEAPIGGLVSPAGKAYYLDSYGSYKDETYAVGAVREEADGSARDLAEDGHAVLRSGMLPGIVSAGHPSLVTRNLLLSHGRFTPGGDRRAFFAPLLWDDQDRPYCPDRDQLARVLGRRD